MLDYEPNFVHFINRTHTTVFFQPIKFSKLKPLAKPEGAFFNCHSVGILFVFNHLLLMNELSTGSHLSRVVHITFNWLSLDQGTLIKTCYKQNLYKQLNIRPCFSGISGNFHYQGGGTQGQTILGIYTMEPPIWDWFQFHMGQGVVGFLHAVV